MEHQSREFRLESFVSVPQIANDGMPDAVEVDAQLVPPTRMGIGSDKRKEAEAIFHFEFGLRLLPPIIDSHSAGTELPQRAVNGSAGALDNTLEKRKIGFLYLTTTEPVVEISVCRCISSKEDHTAYLLVETVDDIQPLASLPLQEIEKRIFSGLPLRYGDNIFRFVDRNEITMFVKNLKTHGSLIQSSGNTSVGK